MELSPGSWRKLHEVSTASLTSELLKLGFRNTFMAGVRPLRPDARLVGYAFTLRYVPARGDLDFQVEYDNWTNPQRVAVETIGPDQVLVIDARGQTGAASLGHILCTRLMGRRAAGLVTDGALRDSPAIAALDFPSYAGGAHATTSSVLHHPADFGLPIGCGGVMVQPGDVVVGDGEGVVVIPAGVAEDVTVRCRERDRLEAWLQRRVAGMRRRPGSLQPHCPMVLARGVLPGRFPVPAGNHPNWAMRRIPDAAMVGLWLNAMTSSSRAAAPTEGRWATRWPPRATGYADRDGVQFGCTATNDAEANGLCHQFRKILNHFGIAGPHVRGKNFYIGIGGPVPALLTRQAPAGTRNHLGLGPAHIHPRPGSPI